MPEDEKTWEMPWVALVDDVENHWVEGFFRNEPSAQEAAAMIRRGGYNVEVQQVQRWQNVHYATPVVNQDWERAVVEADGLDKMTGPEPF